MTETQKKVNMIDGNKIFLYGEFNEEMSISIIPGLLKIIEDLEKKKDPIIDIYINSGGGYTETCFELVSIIERSQKNGIKFRMHAYGGCHSSASILFVCGDERRIGPYVNAIIHDCSSTFRQSSNAMIRNIADHVELVNKNIVSVYTKHTKANKDRLEKVMQQDMYTLSADEMIRLGFADKIV